MSPWIAHPKRPAIRRSGGRALIGVAVLVVSLGFYAYKYWKTSSLAPVVGAAWVADGDTLEISGARIRLEGIDAPELDQTCADDKGHSWWCGRTATRELRAYVRGRELKCEPTGFDQFERVLAICFLPDGSDLNAWMVRQGWALASGYGKTYQSEQDEAKAAKRGIWAGTFTPPREWRHSHPH
jgi:endonuclease YncB( thermonuclease family)